MSAPDMNTGFKTFGNAQVAMMESITGPPADQLLRLSGILDAPAKPDGTTHDVIENAAGAGILTIKLKAALPPDAKVRIVAGDLEPTMVQLAAQRIESAGWHDVEAKVMDGMNVPFDDESFDYSFIHFGIQLYPDSAKGLSESIRILRRGGTVGVTTWHTPGFLPLLQLADPSFPTPPPMRVPLAQPDSAASVLVQAGCAPERLKVEEICLPVPFESAQGFIDTMRLGMKALFDDAERNERVKRVIEDKYGKGPFVLNWEGLAVVGEKA